MLQFAQFTLWKDRPHENLQYQVIFTFLISTALIDLVAKISWTLFYAQHSIYTLFFCAWFLCKIHRHLEEILRVSRYCCSLAFWLPLYRYVCGYYCIAVVLTKHSKSCLPGSMRADFPAVPFSSACRSSLLCNRPNGNVLLSHAHFWASRRCCEWNKMEVLKYHGSHNNSKDL